MLLRLVFEQLTDDLLRFSSNETLTGGIWIDGKPIYRNVITGTWTSGTVFDIPFSLVDKIIKLNIIAYDNGGGFVSSYYQQSEDSLNAYYNTSGKYFRLRRGSVYPALPMTYYLTVEYTKTTN